MLCGHLAAIAIYYKPIFIQLYRIAKLWNFKLLKIAKFGFTWFLQFHLTLSLKGFSLLLLSKNLFQALHAH